MLLYLITATKISIIICISKSFTSFNTSLRIHTFYGAARVVLA
uniref:Uncharacterized protein n=1 Tax=CrAss-like virus sp. ctXt06 TaxID=2825837 RepID=A0A8S5V732_9CAUD|nr:MAG TPA: hypothetical protein [CrAss-like virus sp. ctXt06]